MADLDVIAIDQTAKPAFDYDSLSPSDAQMAREAVKRIAPLVERSVETIVEIGLELRAVKTALGHGSFMRWLEHEFPLVLRMAQHWMKVGEHIGQKYAKRLSHLPLGTVYQLSANISSELRKDVIARLDNGEHVERSEIESKLVADRKVRADARTQAMQARRRNKGKPENDRQRIAREKRNESAKTKYERVAEAEADAVALILSRLGEDDRTELSRLVGIAGSVWLRGSNIDRVDIENVEALPTA